MSREDFLNYSLVEFEGHFFKAPADPNIYLKRMYGDYMQLPSEKDRVSKHPNIAVKLVER